MKMKKLLRKVHYWGSIIIAIPLLLVICTGILLQVKKQFPWVQPLTMKGNPDIAPPSFAAILEKTKTIQQAKVSSWKNIDRLDVRPKKGVIKVRCKNSWEIQLDYELNVLQVAYRRSDFIESLHDGSFFYNITKLGIFLPSAIILLILLVTGIYLFILPIQSKRKKKAKKKNKN